MYSVKYGWTPFLFLLKKRDFYKERRAWLKKHENAIMV